MIGPACMTKHIKSLGFTNRMAFYLILMLFCGLIGGFYLAVKSIESDYSGALACYTIVFTPIGTALSIVLAKIVDKNKAENTGETTESGEGISYMIAKQNIKSEG